MIDIFDYIKGKIEEKDLLKNEFDNEIKEIVQRILLAGLSTTDFFENNVFHGGTALRIVHNINRYSKDLDFNMLKKNNNFKWNDYTQQLDEYTLKNLGFKFVYDDSSNEDYNLKRMTVKDNSVIDIIHGKNLVPIKWTKKKGGQRKNPEITVETGFYQNTFGIERKEVNFPEKHCINVFDINSLFSGKLSACLTRSGKIKETEERVRKDEARDWYDLIWYIDRGIEPNYIFLFDKLNNEEKYKGKIELKDINTNWIKNELFLMVEDLDCKMLNDDIVNFTKINDRIVLSKDILLNFINTMGKDRCKN